jgi:hypothetical protein
MLSYLLLLLRYVYLTVWLVCWSVLLCGYYIRESPNFAIEAGEHIELWHQAPSEKK